jgi:hypothetical protein
MLGLHQVLMAFHLPVVVAAASELSLAAAAAPEVEVATKPTEVPATRLPRVLLRAITVEMALVGLGPQAVVAEHLRLGPTRLATRGARVAMERRQVSAEQPPFMRGVAAVRVEKILLRLLAVLAEAVLAECGTVVRRRLGRAILVAEAEVVPMPAVQTEAPASSSSGIRYEVRGEG